MTRKPQPSEKNKTDRFELVADPAHALVVLPALNEAVHVEECVRSLMQPQDWAAGCSFVVMDGGSTDGTQEIVRRLAGEYSNLQLKENPQRLQSAGINAAVDSCANPSHRVLVRCDVHSVYPEGHIRILMEELNLRGAASVVTSMDATGRTGFQRASAWIVDSPLGSGGSAHRGGKRAKFVDHGHHAAFDLAWFRRVGGYDPTISHNEDAEYDLRLTRAGGRIWLTNKTRVCYTVRSSLRSLWRQYWSYGYGRANTLLKHCEIPRIRQVIPVLNVWLLVASIFALLATPLGLAWPALYLLMLTVTSIVAIFSLRGIDGVWAGPALAAIHIAWGLGFMQRVLEPLDANRSITSSAGQLE